MRMAEVPWTLLNTPHATIALSNYVSTSSFNSQANTKLSHASRKLCLANVMESIVEPHQKIH
jgi:hypothetical protein